MRLSPTPTGGDVPGTVFKAEAVEIEVRPRIPKGSSW